MPEENLPQVDDELIEWLQDLYPNRVPDIDSPEREVWALVGEQRVVARLVQLRDQLNDNILES